MRQGQLVIEETATGTAVGAIAISSSYGNCILLPLF
jgi:hypothetical protein